jgi:hypothetical protein
LIGSNINRRDGLKLAAAGLAIPRLPTVPTGSGAAIIISPAASSANQRAAAFQPHEALGSIMILLSIV